MKLLIVDDSNLIRTRIAQVAGHAPEQGMVIVGLARNGAQAVQLAQQHRPDVVTMDLTMPEMDGISAIRELMRLQPPPNILVVSALADKSTAILALKLGARGFLCKPFTDDELRNALFEVATPHS